MFVGGSAALGIALVQSFRRLWGGRLADHRENLSGAFSACGGIYAFLLGLTSVQAMTRHLEARAATNEEAGLVMTIYRQAGVFPEATRRLVRGELRGYVERIVREDWPAHVEGRESLATLAAAGETAQAILEVEPEGPLQMGVKGAMVGALGETMKVARTRHRLAEGGLPFVFWLVALGGGALTIALAALVETKSLKVDLVRVGSYAGMVGLLLFLIVVLGRPFHPFGGLSSEPYQRARAIMGTIGD